MAGQYAIAMSDDSTYTTPRIKKSTKDRLNKIRHELYQDTFDSALNALMDEHEKLKR